jgi:hypothetical protein
MTTRSLASAGMLLLRAVMPKAMRTPGIPTA